MVRVTFYFRSIVSIDIEKCRRNLLYEEYKYKRVMKCVDRHSTCKNKCAPKNRIANFDGGTTSGCN